MPAFPDFIPITRLLRMKIIIDPHHQLPVLGLFGHLSEDCWAGLASVCNDLPDPVVVFDFTNVTHCQTSTDDAAAFGRQLARQASATPSRSHHALIAPGDLLYGLCRVIQMNLDMAHLKAGVFRSLDSALKWLKEEKMLPQKPLA